MSAPSVVRLSFLSGPRDGETVELAVGQEALVIGRARDCALVLADDPDVSREHASLAWNGGAWILTDLDSRNGTFVGEFAAARRVESGTPLPSATVFRVGNTRLRVEPESGRREVATTATAAIPR
jgi:pSer/pThr/pTyr-binding forkhead associated (FHA) protein